MSTRTLTLTAMLAAICCILGPVTLPIGPIPLSLTTGILMGMALIMGVPAYAAGYICPWACWAYPFSAALPADWAYSWGRQGDSF